MSVVVSMKIVVDINEIVVEGGVGCDEILHHP